MAAVIRCCGSSLRSAAMLRGPLRVSAANKSKLAKKSMPSKIALEHFDAYYPKVFGAKEWRSIRLALLSEQKYCAVVNPYADSVELDERLRALGAEVIVASPVSQHWPSDVSVEMSAVPGTVSLTEEEVPHAFKDSSRIIQKGNSEPLLTYVPATEMIYQEDVIHEEDYFNFLKPETEILVKTHKPLPLPPLKIFTFPSGVVSDFPSPRKTADGLIEYYLMDAASILPVMALGLKEGDDFADFCAAPGGKTLAAAFITRTGSHLCTDVSPSRVARLKNTIQSYLPEELGSKIEVKKVDMTSITNQSAFDKILVDVPCTNDRHSLHEDENSIFKNIRIQERLEMPQTQTRILKHALKLLRPGGVAVYSTCSLSPVQNDSVVHMSIQSFGRMKFVVTNLTESFKPLETYFELHKCHYGQLVLPFLPNNFGPMYISRIERVL